MYLPVVFKLYLSHGLWLFIAFMLSFSNGLSPLIGRAGRIRFRMNVEFLFVIIIVAILMVLAMKSYLPLVTSAKVINAVGFFENTRVNVVTYHAINGHWPQDNLSLQSIPGYSGSGDMQDPYVQKADVIDGAIHLYLANDLAGEILTIRPAMPLGSSESIIWVSGNQRSAEEWNVVGEDKTTFDTRYIVRQLR